MPVRIISAEATGAPDAFWYARPESGIKSLADTNGKTIAFSSPGSSTNLILLQLVNQAKVDAQAGRHRRRAGHPHAGDVRADRRRLVGAAVRVAAARRWPPHHHRARQRRSRAGAADDSRQRRQRQCAQAEARRLRALHQGDQPRHRLGLFRPRRDRQLRRDRQGAARASPSARATSSTPRDRCSSPR